MNRTTMITLFLAGTALGAPAAPPAMLHRPGQAAGTVWQDGRANGTYASSYRATVNGGWLYRADGKVVATMPSSAAPESNVREACAGSPWLHPLLLVSAL